MHLAEVISYCSNRIPQTWCTDFCRYLYCRLSLHLPSNSEIILEIQRWAKLPFFGCDLRECCRQVEAEVLSNNRKKFTKPVNKTLAHPLVKFYRLGIGEMLQHERDAEGDATMQSAAPTRVAGERGGGSRDAVR